MAADTPPTLSQSRFRIVLEQLMATRTLAQLEEIVNGVASCQMTDTQASVIRAHARVAQYRLEEAKT